MKKHLRRTTLHIRWPLACLALLPISFRASALDRADHSSSVATSVITARSGQAAASATAGDDENVSIEAIETANADGPVSSHETAWLGISSREASEDLTAQLDLQPGVGLVVTNVGPDSPAAKAGLKKHDVLTGFGDQALVH